MARRQPKTSTAVDLASEPRTPAPALPPAIVRRCRVCGLELVRAYDSRETLCATHRGAILNIKEEKAKAKELLEGNARRYAELHMDGAELAAARGDTRPAEWALLHTRTVESVKGQGEGAQGVIVQIGMILPGCGGDAPVVSVTTKSVEAPVLDAEVAGDA